MTCVHDNGIAHAVLLGEQVLVELVEGSGIHGLDVNIGYATTGKAVHHVLVATYPTLVEQFLLLAPRDGTHHYLLLLTLYAKACGLASLTCKHGIVIDASLYLLSVYGHDDVTSLDVLAHIQRTTGEHLCHLDTRTLICLVGKDTQLGNRQTA